MRSDGIVQAEPLGKFSCLCCGSAFRPGHRRFKRAAADHHYSLNAGAQNTFDQSRHEGYAGAICAGLASPPRRIIDVGCGNGALLAQLRQRWPDSSALGIEPAALPRSQAHQRGIDAVEALAPGMRADLVVSVNVIEHTDGPGQFLRQLARATVPGGQCVVIWPDDRRPSTELLFNDHRFSLPAAVVAQLASDEGLCSTGAVEAPDGFQGLRFVRRAIAKPAGTRNARGRIARGALELAQSRVRYLRRWGSIGAQLTARLEPAKLLVGFGFGEAAHYLRAYAPALWERVTALTADELSGEHALGLPLVALTTLDPSAHQLLLAAHPRWHRKLEARLTSQGFKCIAWDHLIER
jgi:SAM-dependent methyltransferase